MLHNGHSSITLTAFINKVPVWVKSRRSYLVSGIAISPFVNTPSETIVYKLSQQKPFFVNARLKFSMAHHRLMTFGYFAIFPSAIRHLISYLVTQIICAIAILVFGRNEH